MAQTVPPKAIPLLVLIGIFSPLAILAVIARLASRRIKEKSWTLDDWLIIAGLVFSLGLNVSGILYVTIGGIGRHLADVPAEDLMRLPGLLVASVVLWAAATSFIKASILVFYLSIFDPYRFFKIATYVVLTITVICALAVCLEQIGGVESMAILSAAILNFLLDCAIVALPMPVLWRLQMPLSKKVGISCVFAVGLVICVFSGLRISSSTETDYNDYTYTATGQAIYGAMEVYLGVICACVPMSQPVMIKIGASIDSLYSRLTGSTLNIAKEIETWDNKKDTTSIIPDIEGNPSGINLSMNKAHTTSTAQAIERAGSSQSESSSKTGIKVQRDVEVFKSSTS